MAEQFPPMREYPVDRSILRAEKARAEEGEMYSDQLQYSGPVAPDECAEMPLENRSIEELGKMFDQITNDVESLLERRENIRQVFNAKISMANEMAHAIQEKFGNRTGLNTVMRAEGIDHRERF